MNIKRQKKDLGPNQIGSPLDGISFMLFLVLVSCFLFNASLVQPVMAQEASFYLWPLKGNYNVGQTFPVDVMVNVEGISMNAAQAKIYFPPDKLKVIRISKSNSIFSLWVQEPIFSNSKGEISFIGGLPSPGFIGRAGKIFTIYFYAETTGEAKVSFSGEKILANDPWGTNIFSFSQEGIYSIFAPGKIPPKIPTIDTQPPYPFEITVDNEGDLANPQPLLYFETRDDLSGISHYETRIGSGEAFMLFPGETTPFRLPHQAPGDHSLIVKAVDRAGNFTESTTTVKIESIPIPQITVCPQTFISGEEIFHIEGTSPPNHTIIIFLKRGDELIKTWEIPSNEKGEWSFESSALFKSGIYKISARTKNSKGAISHSSEECIFKIILSGISVGPWVISYKVLILLALILLIIMAIIVCYFLNKVRKTQRLIEKETKDLKKKFYKEYNELQADIKKELALLRKIKKKRRLTEKEKKIEENLLKNLLDIKKVLRKELKDIEEIK